MAYGHGIGIITYIKEEKALKEDKERTSTGLTRGYLTLKCDPDILISESDKAKKEQIIAIFKILGRLDNDEYEVAPKGTVYQ
jgi:hypothetical protein